MRHITTADYKEISRVYKNNAGHYEWYRGDINIECPDAGTCNLNITAINYHNSKGDLVDIVPVWWDFSAFNEQGEAIISDFNFTDLKSYLF